MSRLIEELVSDTRTQLRDNGTDCRVDTKFIKELVAAMKDLLTVIRNVYDLPSYDERFNMKTVQKKLELETEKTSAGAADDGVTVVLAHELSEWSE